MLFATLWQRAPLAQAQTLMFDIIILLIMLLFVLILLFVIFSAFLGYLITKVPFVPTSAEDISFIVQKLTIGKNQIFYDLGSGNGKVCFLVHKLCGAKCVGFELTWWTHLWAKIKKRCLQFSPLLRGDAQRAERLLFKNQDFFKANWREADFIYGYLFPFLMVRVEEKFLQEGKAGSIAIIRDFRFPNLKPTETFYLPKKHEIYIYKKQV